MIMLKHDETHDDVEEIAPPHCPIYPWEKKLSYLGAIGLAMIAVPFTRQTASLACSVEYVSYDSAILGVEVNKISGDLEYLSVDYNFFGKTDSFEMKIPKDSLLFEHLQPNTQYTITFNIHEADKKSERACTFTTLDGELPPTEEPVLIVTPAPPSPSPSGSPGTTPDTTPDTTPEITPDVTPDITPSPVPPVTPPPVIPPPPTPCPDGMAGEPGACYWPYVPPVTPPPSPTPDNPSDPTPTPSDPTPTPADPTPVTELVHPETTISVEYRRIPLNADGAFITIPIIVGNVTTNDADSITSVELYNDTRGSTAQTYGSDDLNNYADGDNYAPVYAYLFGPNEGDTAEVHLKTTYTIDGVEYTTETETVTINNYESQDLISVEYESGVFETDDDTYEYALYLYVEKRTDPTAGTMKMQSITVTGSDLNITLPDASTGVNTDIESYDVEDIIHVSFPVEKLTEGTAYTATVSYIYEFNDATYGTIRVPCSKTITFTR